MEFGTAVNKTARSAVQLVLLMINYRGVTLAFPLSCSTSYDQLIQKVLGKWPELPSSNLRFHYSIGEYENVCMAGEDDFPGLLLLITQYKACRVNVEIINELLENDQFAQLSRDGYRPQQAQFVNKSSNCGSASYANPSCMINDTHNDEVDDDEDDMPAFDVNPRVITNPLLSDGWSNNIRGIGQKFIGGVVEFRSELIKYAARLAFKYKFRKNNPSAVSVYCSQKDNGCGWKICGTVKGYNKFFVINKAELKHTCSDILVRRDTSRLNPKVCSSMVIDHLKNKPTTTGVEVLDILKGSYGVKMPYHKAWRTLQCARDVVFGHYKESFEQLRWYAAVAQKTNPGTEVFYESDFLTKHFCRFFIAFKSSLDGFRYCRPMLFIDATSLKGKFKGQLLTAIAKDGNNHLFPVAFAIVDAETIEHWTFFLAKLKDIIKHDKEVFYLSDRHIGIMTAFTRVWEKPVHFFCLYHLYVNLKGVFSGSWSNEFRKKMVGLLRACAYAPTVSLYREAVAEFEQVGGPLAVKFLETIPPERWAVSHCVHVKRYGEMTSNAAESFNNRLKKIRSLPAAYMIDMIRQVIMEWYVERREASSSWTGALCPKREHNWNSKKEAGRSWQIKTANEEKRIYEVITPNVSHVVDLVARTCTCYEWQVKGFPCHHAVNVICLHMSHISGIVDSCFFTSSFIKAYAVDIMPVPTSMRPEAERALPSDEAIKPPKCRAAPGRPKRKRIPSFGEYNRKKDKPWKCPYCSLSGRHDSLMCAARLAAESDEESTTISD